MADKFASLKANHLKITGHQQLVQNMRIALLTKLQTGSGRNDCISVLPKTAVADTRTVDVGRIH